MYCQRRTAWNRKAGSGRGSGSVLGPVECAGMARLLVLPRSLLPVATVEFHGLHLRGCQIEIVQHAHVDGIELRRSARASEDMDAAHAAKMVLGDPRPELIRSDLALSRQQAKLLR